MAVFDTMRHIRPDVSTVCVGLAASMGAFLLASGQQGKRYSLANSRIMIHQPLGGAQGQAADIEIQVRAGAGGPVCFEKSKEAAGGSSAAHPGPPNAGHPPSFPACPRPRPLLCCRPTRSCTTS